MKEDHEDINYNKPIIMSGKERRGGLRRFLGLLASFYLIVICIILFIRFQ